MIRNAFPCTHCERSLKSEQGLDDHLRDKHGLTVPQRVVVVAPVADTSDPSCMECGEVAKLVGGDVIYPHRPDLYAKHFWLCECGARCGCHGVTTRPLGQPCGPTTRRARMAAHDAFDPFWRSGRMPRTDAYAWLASAMGMTREQCHIGMMTAAEAWQVVAYCRERIAA